MEINLCFEWQRPKKVDLCLCGRVCVFVRADFQLNEMKSFDIFDGVCVCVCGVRAYLFLVRTSSLVLNNSKPKQKWPKQKHL